MTCSGGCSPPTCWQWRCRRARCDRDGLAEVATNLTGEYAHRACCVLGVRGSLIRDNKAFAAAVTEALLESQEFVFANPDEAAAIFAPYSLATKPEQLAAMLRSHPHNHHPLGADLRQEIAAYVEELKGISVIKPSTNADRFSDKVYANVLS
jgi:NitT/TauT family transport system substrate-binding protein